MPSGGEISAHIFNTSDSCCSPADLSNTAMPKVAKAVKSQQNTFHGLAHYCIKSSTFACHTLLSGRVRLADLRFPETITHPHPRHQESCHLFYGFSVSVKVKGHGAKCVWECFSLTRCMCFCSCTNLCLILCDLTVDVFVSDNERVHETDRHTVDWWKMIQLSFTW